MTQRTRNHMLMVLPMIGLFLLAMAFVASVSGSVQSISDAGTLIPNFHCTDNPKIENCTSNEGASSDKYTSVPINLIATIVTMGATGFFTVFSYAIVLIREETEPTEKRKMKFTLVLSMIGVILALTGLFFTHSAT